MDLTLERAPMRVVFIVTSQRPGTSVGRGNSIPTGGGEFHTRTRKKKKKTI